MPKISAVWLVLWVLSACQPSAPAPNPNPEATAVSASDTAAWAGHYQGQLPCPNCDYIEAKLSLAPDLRYQLSTRHVGRIAGELPQHHSGQAHWRVDGLLQLDAAADNMVFFVDGQTMQMRGNDGKAYANFKGEICTLQKSAEGSWQK